MAVNKVIKNSNNEEIHYKTNANQVTRSDGKSVQDFFDNGGVIKGDVILGNNKFLKGKKTTGEEIKLINLDGMDQVVVGNETSNMTIFAKTRPLISEGGKNKQLATMDDIQWHNYANVIDSGAFTFIDLGSIPKANYLVNISYEQTGSSYYRNNYAFILSHSGGWDGINIVRIISTREISVVPNGYNISPFSDIECIFAVGGTQKIPDPMLSSIHIKLPSPSGIKPKNIRANVIKLESL